MVSGPSTRSFTRMNSIAKRKAPASMQYRPRTIRSGTPTRRHRTSAHARTRAVSLRRVVSDGREQRSAATREGTRRPTAGPGTAVVISHQEAADTPDGISEGQGRRRRCKHGHEREAADPNHREPRSDTSNEAAEPARPPTTDEERDDRFLAVVLECPEQLCADECADQTEHGGIECCLSSPLRASSRRNTERPTRAATATRHRSP
jgi:hypothetical protein